MLLRAAVTLILCLWAAFDATATDDPHKTTCKVIRGTIVPACNGTLCTQGSVTGDLPGRFTSKVTSIYPAGSGWIYTAWMQIYVDGTKGRLEILVDGAAAFDSKGGPDLSHSTEVLTISEATDDYAGYTGTLVVNGAHALGPATRYVGRLCHPMARP